MPNRAEVKQNAKASLQGTKPSIYLITVVYLIIVLVLEFLTIKVTWPGVSFSQMIEIYRSGDVSSLMYAGSTMGEVLQSIIGFMSTVIGVGFTMVCLNLSRGLKAGFGELFDGFGMFFKIVWLNILTSIFILLWACLLVVPGIVAAYRYRMAMYILIDNPEFSALECISRSKQMMIGHKLELFVYDLSFLGWAILCAIPFVTIYVTPYVETTYACYYNALSGYMPQVEYNVQDDEQNGSGGREYDNTKDPWE